jgi:hypothetical protein
MSRAYVEGICRGDTYVEGTGTLTLSGGNWIKSKYGL